MNKVYDRFLKLRNVLKQAENFVCKEYIEYPITLVLAGTAFERRALKRALQLVKRESVSHRPTNDVILGHTNGSRYSFKKSAALRKLGEKIDDLQFEELSITISQM